MGKLVCTKMLPDRASLQEGESTLHEEDDDCPVEVAVDHEQPLVLQQLLQLPLQPQVWICAGFHPALDLVCCSENINQVVRYSYV